MSLCLLDCNFTRYLNSAIALILNNYHWSAWPPHNKSWPSFLQSTMIQRLIESGIWDGRALEKNDGMCHRLQWVSEARGPEREQGNISCESEANGSHLSVSTLGDHYCLRCNTYRAEVPAVCDSFCLVKNAAASIMLKMLISYVIIYIFCIKRGIYYAWEACTGAWCSCKIS